jgi:hypothetical protein
MSKPCPPRRAGKAMIKTLVPEVAAATEGTIHEHPFVPIITATNLI